MTSSSFNPFFAFDTSRVMCWIYSAKLTTKMNLYLSFNAKNYTDVTGLFYHCSNFYVIQYF